MKQQTFIVKCIDAAGITKDFYRFSYKKPETVFKKLKEAVTGIDTDYWYKSWWREEIENLICYATPDGYTESEIVWSISFTDLFSGNI